MSRRTNFIDGNDSFREQNLRFVRNEFEDNINQFFGSGNDAGPANGPGQSDSGAPPRDSIIAQPTPGNYNESPFRSAELDQRRQYLRQLGISRNRAHIMSIASFKVPDFNLGDIRRQRYRLSLEAGDSRQAEVDAIIVRQITAMLELRPGLRHKERPRTPPPPRDIDWHGELEGSRDLRDVVPRQRDASPENVGLFRRFDGDDCERINSSWQRNENFDQRNENVRDRNDPFRNDNFQLRNENCRGRHENFDRDDNIHGHVARYDNVRDRNDDYREVDRFNYNHPRFMDNNRNPSMEDINLNRRQERFRDAEPIIYSNHNNRQISNSNFGSDRRQASPENCPDDNFRGERRRSFSRTFDDSNRFSRNFDDSNSFGRNFEKSNLNDYDDDYRAVPRKLHEENYSRNSPEHRRMETCYPDDRNEPRSYNERNETYREEDFREQQSDLRSRGSIFGESFHNNIRNDDDRFQRIENADNFACRSNFENDFNAELSNSFDDRNEILLYNRNQYNADYNALLNFDDRLDFNQDFRDRTNGNHNNSSTDFQSGNQSINDNFRSFDFSEPDRNMMQSDNLDLDDRHEFNQDFSDRSNCNFIQSGNQSGNDNFRSFDFSGPSTDPMQSQLQNRYSQQSMKQAGKKSLNRANQMKQKQQPNKQFAANLFGNNRSKGPNPNKPSTTQTQNLQHPPNRAAKWPLLAAPTGPRNRFNQSNINDNGTNLNGPCTWQAAHQIRQQQQKLPLKPFGTAQKRRAESSHPGAPTKAEIKRRKMAEKRGFLIGGHKLPYINRSGKLLPQPEDTSYAVTFFEHEPIYNTSIYAINNDEMGPMTDIDDDEEDENTDEEATDNGPTGILRVALRKHHAIRKKINMAWTKLYRSSNFKCWPTWWKAYKWCEPEMNRQLEKFGSLNIRQKFLPIYPKKSTAHVINMVMKAAHFALEENTGSHYRNAKALYVVMNETFLENLSLDAMEQLQDMIRGAPNHLWVYKMRSTVYLWAEYHKIINAKPRNERNFVAIHAQWKSPVFHWMCKQAFDELKAISAIEWSDHSTEYPHLESTL
ncbi:uncharacterized protein DDB_G0287625 isoform X1 [Drosophila grimshawi]|uniref:uncharacterized protein DDB_G0287625 isoform X1 n=1 Tax=Drosophila grimshawi TaxID=7222 RepID=UPI000C8714AC|nr:uncharacterized protein DDB_G0287625 isoform X1 [Drosophila grimshawi]